MAKAYVKEIFGGLNPKLKPKSSTFENKYGQSTGTYMWQVARLHYFQMLEKSQSVSPDIVPKEK